MSLRITENIGKRVTPSCILLKLVAKPRKPTSAIFIADGFTVDELYPKPVTLALMKNVL